jgi:uncharacterized phage-associated protein
MTIEFKLHPRKAVEVAAMFLKLHKQPMHYFGLLKLLYMADRLSLEKFSTPVTGDRYVAMQHGPVLSCVYDLIQDKEILDVPNALRIWSQYISKIENYKVRLLGDPDVGELCEDDEDIIHEVYSNRGNLDRFELLEITHRFPEWKNPNGTSILIKVEDILRYVGKSTEEIEAIQKDVEHENYLDSVLSLSYA